MRKKVVTYLFFSNFNNPFKKKTKIGVKYFTILYRI